MRQGGVRRLRKLSHVNQRLPLLLSPQDPGESVPEWSQEVTLWTHWWRVASWGMIWLLLPPSRFLLLRHSYYVAWSGLEWKALILLPKPPECWDPKCVPHSCSCVSTKGEISALPHPQAHLLPLRNFRLLPIVAAPSLPSCHSCRKVLSTQMPAHHNQDVSTMWLLNFANFYIENRVS